MTRGFCVVCALESEFLDDGAVCPVCGGEGGVVEEELVVSAPATVVAEPVVEDPAIHGGAVRSFATVGSVPVGWVPVPGDVLLDLYEVQGLLGEGGMGTVHRVHHRGWGLDLAVKSPKVGVKRVIARIDGGGRPVLSTQAAAAGVAGG